MKEITTTLGMLHAVSFFMTDLDLEIKTVSWNDLPERRSITVKCRFLKYFGGKGTRVHGPCQSYCIAMN